MNLYNYRDMSKTEGKKYLKSKRKIIFNSTSDDNINDEIEDELLDNKIDKIRESLVENYIKQKKLMNELNELLKLSKNKTVKSNSIEYYNFDKLQKIPASLKKLLKINEDSLPRSKITCLMYQYFTDNKMYNTKTKKEIIPNKQIKRIFSMEDGDIIDFYNLQLWLKKLYDAEK